MTISGTFPVGNEVGHVINEATDNLIPQCTIEDSGLATLMLDKKLYLLKREKGIKLLDTMLQKDFLLQ